MKRICYIVLALLGATMCARQEIPGQEHCGRKVTIHAVAAEGTKALDENAVQSVAVWLFDNLNAYRNGLAAKWFCYSSGTSLTAEYDSEQNVAVVVANLPEYLIDVDNPMSAANLSFDIRNTALTLDVMTDALVMSGLSELSDVDDLGEAMVIVSRRVSKITVEKVTNRIEETAWASKPLTLRSAYVINGVGRIPIRPDDSAFTPSVGDFFSCSCMYSPAVGPFPDFGQMEAPGCAFASVDRTVPLGGSISTDVTLYTGQNRIGSMLSTSLSDLMESTSWSVRRSKLVLECSLGGYTCYYPVSLPALRTNSRYRIREIVIKHYGSDSPDSPVSFADILVDGEIVSWDGGYINETI
ncbi:MAG: hypothetical protein IKR15_02660 [Bacteroidales bacterium]|nr:hypothetical protein [Bacteroidales bacterium]